MTLYKIIENAPGTTVYLPEIKLIGTLAGGQLELFFIRERGWLTKRYEVKFALNFTHNTRSYLGASFDTLEEAKRWAEIKCDEIFNWQ